LVLDRNPNGGYAVYVGGSILTVPGRTEMESEKDALSATELKIMKYFWKKEPPVYVGDIVQYFRREYQKECARQTIGTFVRQLEGKGYLAQGTEYTQRLGYPYTCLVSEEEYTRRQLSRYTDQHFGGSAYNFILSLLKTQKVSKEEKERLKKYIDHMKEMD